MTTPIYLIIENDIKAAINNGSFKSGDLIPSENELKEKYNVSRMTVRQALNNLVNEGLLFRHQGKGTFVSNAKIEKSIQGIRSFTEEMEATNRKVSSKVITFKEIKANQIIAEKLFLKKGDLIYYIERIRYGNNVPVLFEILHIPKNIFPNITKKDLEGSFYKYLEKELKLKVSHCKQSIEAKKPSKELANILNINVTEPILYIERDTYLSNGRPFEIVRSFYRSDQYKFVQMAVK
ncbi:MAG: GntR family transcriptional regulator [Acholeplasmatales bacterium]|jgi:GntR family transcriptional regulator|nr:GntR family transcriptional regulator [Acholeplasmataceae bacterium]MDY0115010.1 GntR family transcriptional regulator [Acholeplasmatales bacterium]MCK9233729.1 GntR family transcriptional regulator [Acholeplasmataceae bacterium]MCK9289011.1 GntR family transcriptional regulator [Acholeplasmataceae bacterium]MCK9427706.1 GntR family transcriptional regulator [Acholeplasmataceae bacterium]